MDVRTLVPWARGKNAPASRFDDEGSPFFALHREMNRLFDDFFHGFDMPALHAGWGGGWPRVDVDDSGKEIRITAELPGMEEKDVELTLHEGTLTIRGEKKNESETAQYSERWQGRFERSFPVGPEIDPEKIKAAFKNGVLTVTLERKPEAQSPVRRIPINA